MEKALSFLSRHKDVAFATVEENKPKIRVFQIMKREKATLYFATATHKEVYQQLQKKSFCGITCNGWKYFSKSKGKSYL